MREPNYLFRVNIIKQILKYRRELIEKIKKEKLMQLLKIKITKKQNHLLIS